jgi:hypothetical protein
VFFRRFSELAFGIQAAVLNAKLPLINMVAQDKMRHVNIQLHLKGIISKYL